MPAVQHRLRPEVVDGERAPGAPPFCDGTLKTFRFKAGTGRDSEPPGAEPPAGYATTTLQRLERDGFVESDGTGGAKTQNAYTITPSGTDELKAWLLTPSDVIPPPRDELVMKVLVAMGVPGVDLPGLLQAHRRHLVQAMQEYTRLKAEIGDGEVELALALLGGLLGIGAAYTVVLAGSSREQLTELARVPYAELAVIAVGVPLAALVLGWLFAGREPRSLRSERAV